MQQTDSGILPCLLTKQHHHWHFQLNIFLLLVSQNAHTLHDIISWTIIWDPMRHIRIKKGMMLHKIHKYSYIDVYLPISPCTYSLPAEATSQSEDAPTVKNHDLINPRCLRDLPQQISFQTVLLIPRPHLFFIVIITQDYHGIHRNIPNGKGFWS